jgi:large subunit ribosomal protein L32
MPLPKRRLSRSRGRKRRSHQALRPVILSVCPRCSQARPPHRVCSNCGYYGDLDVLALEEK